MEALIILFLTAIFLLFLVSFFVYAYRSIRKDKAREEFYRAVHSILGRAESDEQALAQISIIYRKVAQRHPQITAACRDTIALMEDFLYCANSNGLERFRRLYKFELSDDDMRRIARMVDLMKEREPFTSVSSKYANLLNTLRRALGSNNSDLGISTLRQLADDIEVLENALTAQGRRNQISFVISAVGVVLTVVFGAISAISLVKSHG